MSESADQALLELVREGNERAFEALVLRYRGPLRSYCIRLGVPADGTEDVIQQALLEAWVALRGGAQVHAFKAWLYRVVHNIAVDAIERAPRTVELAPGEAEQAATTQLETPGSGLQETLTAVAALPLLQREAIVRTALAGESHEQVGRYLGLTAGAVKGLIYRGRATLRSALAALVPPWLPRLLASRSGAGSGLRESLSGLGSGAGGTGSAGALVKAGVIVAVAATAVTATTLTGHRSSPKSETTVQRAPRRIVANASGDSPAADYASRLPHKSNGTQEHARSVRPTSIQGRSTPGSAHGTVTQHASGMPVSDSTGDGQAQPRANQPATGAPTQASAGTTGSQPVGNASSTPAESTSGSGTAPAGGTESTSSEQSQATSGSSGSSSSEAGGPVGAVIHTVEKTLETTLEDTLGGLLHH